MKLTSKELDLLKKGGNPFLGISESLPFSIIIEKAKVLTSDHDITRFQQIRQLIEATSVARHEIITGVTGDISTRQLALLIQDNTTSLTYVKPLRVSKNAVKTETLMISAINSWIIVVRDPLKIFQLGWDIKVTKEIIENPHKSKLVLQNNEAAVLTKVP